MKVDDKELGDEENVYVAHRKQRALDITHTQTHTHTHTLGCLHTKFRGHRRADKVARMKTKLVDEQEGGRGHERFLCRLCVQKGQWNVTISRAKI